jgi:hypothetical protein
MSEFWIPMKVHPSPILAATVVTIAVLGLVTISGAKGQSQNPLHLYGHTDNGWGVDPGAISDPGPALTYTLGTQLQIFLHGVDDITHNFFLDFDRDGVLDEGEPVSPNFRGDGPLEYSLTLERAGTYDYRCQYHPGTMVGQFTVEGPAAPANTLLIVGVVVGVIAAAAVVSLVLMRRRKPKEPSE